MCDPFLVWSFKGAYEWEITIHYPGSWKVWAKGRGLCLFFLFFFIFLFSFKCFGFFSMLVFTYLENINKKISNHKIFKSSFCNNSSKEKGWLQEDKKNMKTCVVNTAVLQSSEIWNMVRINPSGIAAISQLLLLWTKLFLNKTLKIFKPSLKSNTHFQKCKISRMCINLKGPDWFIKFYSVHFNVIKDT